MCTRLHEENKEGVATIRDIAGDIGSHGEARRNTYIYPRLPPAGGIKENWKEAHARERGEGGEVDGGTRRFTFEIETRRA